MNDEWMNRITHLQFVIQAQLDIWHATQEDLHHNLAVHVTPQHSPLVAHQHVDLHLHREH